MTVFPGRPKPDADRRPAPFVTSTFDSHLRYQNALFLADWSQGRILAVRPTPEGAGYRAVMEVFMTGSPLNVCDMDVGPDGALYFVTGGRDTHGGLYRVVWTGSVPKEYMQPKEGVAAAVKQPQLNSAWARQRVANLKIQMGDQWANKLAAVAKSTQNVAPHRVRALELLQLLGPQPQPDLLLLLAGDKEPLVRAKSAELLGLNGNAQTRGVLVSMLDDASPIVRRRAAEALVRSGQTAPLPRLERMLASADRFESWAARVLLERSPAASWREDVLASSDHRVFLQGGMALMLGSPTRRPDKPSSATSVVG